ncbi:MAG: hypothetical protein E6G41_15455 [Actinobacteria bacterium]|nr:MAG: hypothetical protein E6G41_15455 [Actinomycetota bacterium]
MAVLVALAWQAAVAGQAIWLSGAAARAAARAHAVGGDATAAARGALPPALARRARVRELEDGAVELALGVPSVVGGAYLATVRTRARFAPQDGRR